MNEFQQFDENQVNYTESKPKKAKKSHITAAVCGAVAGVILIGSGAGFGGAYLASTLTQSGNNTSVVRPSASSYGETPTLDEMQQTAAIKKTDGVEYNSDGTYAYTRDLVAAVKDSIVYVSNYVSTAYEEGYSLGSGIIISSDGYIVTNQHIIAEGVIDCTITVRHTNDDGSVEETDYKATLVGADERTDLAVLKINAQNLQAAVLGDSDELRLGDDIVVIGNPVLISDEVYTLDNSVSKGVVSGLNREISATGKGLTSIQTDAAFNSGNSGGAMFNGYGEVVGIVDFKMVSDYSENLGFGITINDAKQVVEDLISQGYVTGRAMIGIEYQNITQSIAYYNNMTAGLYVTKIYSDYPVAASGLIVGDTIVEIDGLSVLENDVSDILAEKSPGDIITLTVVRSDGFLQRNVTITAELGEYKGD